jgi:hypothetical protein
MIHIADIALRGVAERGACGQAKIRAHAVSEHDAELLGDTAQQ